MEHHQRSIFAPMGTQERLNSQDALAQTLEGLPPEVAAELADHLHEAAEAARRKGGGSVEAEQMALLGLGDPASVSTACLQAVRSDWWLRRGMPAELKAGIAGWMALGLLFISRICVAQEPNAGSIALCVAVGLASVGLGMALLRARRGLRYLAVGISAVLTAVTLGILFRPEFAPGLASAYSLQPALILLITIFGAFSVGILNTARSRRWAT
jgi:hypothetical protein